MQTGTRTRMYPTAAQQAILRRWIGCQRFIHNAKVAEDRYHRAFARKFIGVGEMPLPDQEYSRFIGEETQWLREVPSQILRNGAVQWKKGYSAYFKGVVSGRPTIKKKHGRQSVWLTKELFSFDVTPDGLTLRIRTPRFPVGEIRYVVQVGHHIPNSIRVAVEAGRWYLSFSTDDDRPEFSDQEIADWLAGFGEAELLRHTAGLDRGVCVPLAAQQGWVAAAGEEAARRTAVAVRRQRPPRLRPQDQPRARRRRDAAAVRLPKTSRPRT